MEFDVIKQPWIPVRTLIGEHREVNLLELFKNAQDFSGLDGLNPMEEYSVYRFLSLFLMSIYRPKDKETIEDILKTGHFDMLKVGAYLNTCKNEGVSFDIFNKNRPFLQSPYDPKYDTEKNLKSIAVLDFTMPSGNNTIHFNHQFEADACMTPAQAVIGLLVAQIFCTAGTEGKNFQRPSSINGAPPIFFLPNGKNIFTILALSLVVLPNNENDIELWRNKKIIVPHERVTKTSLLYGLLFPSRRITLVEEGNIIKKAYYQSGLSYVGYNSWTDPYVSYYYIKAKKTGELIKITLKPTLSKEIWRNIGTILKNTDENIPMVINQYREMMDDIGESSMPILTFGVVTNKAAYLDVQRGEIELDARLVGSVEKSSILSQAITLAEKDGYCLKKSLKDVFFLLKKDFYSNEIEAAVHRFYSNCEPKAYEFCRNLAATRTDDETSNVIKKWQEVVTKNAKNIYDEFCNFTCSKAEELISVEQRRKKLYLQLKENNKKEGSE